MKYIIDIPDGMTCINALKYEDSKCVAARSYIIPDLTPYTELDKESTVNEVWDFVKALYGLSDEELYEIFPNGYPYEITCSEAKAKYEAWKREKNEIQIGDEVKIKDLEDKGIVTSVLATRCDVLWFDGTVSEDVLMSELYKTGRHFDEVEELLKKMREGK